MLKQTEDFSECRCPACFQRVPLNRDGNIVKHYTTIRVTGPRNNKTAHQSVCPAVGKSGKAYA